MARQGRVDRGLVQRVNVAGKTVWSVRVGVGDGKEKWFGPFATKTKARDHYQKCKHEQGEERFNPERYQRGGYELVQHLIDAYEPIGRMKKTAKDERFFARWWGERFRGQRVNAITPAVLEQARQDLLGTGITPQRVNRYMAWLRKVLNLAVRDGKLPSNPVTKLKAFKEPKGRTRFLTAEEEEKLMKALGSVYAPWARLAILTGLRQEEQFTLRWTDVNLKRGLITLPATKAGDVQYVPLSEDAKAILHDLDAKAAVVEAEAIAHEKKRRSEWVFPSENPATHLDPRNFYRRVYLPAVEAAGLEDVTWHTLRHTFASRLAMSNHTEGTIATLLRHSSTALVRRYAHLSPSHLTKAIEDVATFGKGTGDPMPTVSGSNGPEKDSNRAGTVLKGEGAEVRCA